MMRMPHGGLRWAVHFDAHVLLPSAARRGRALAEPAALAALLHSGRLRVRYAQDYPRQDRWES